MEIYCGQLGMMTDFGYCLSANTGLPCRNSVACWQERIDIGRILRERFTGDELATAFGGLPKSKVERILESMETAAKEA